MTTTTLPYHELFVLEDEDAFDSRWIFVCNTCRRNVTDQPCPDHAPRDVPGLQRVDCEATPPHPPVWYLAGDGYPPGCPACQYGALADAHDGCEHSHHWAWRRWRITSRAVYWLSRAKIVTSYGWVEGGGCEGCLTRIRTRWSR